MSQVESSWWEFLQRWSHSYHSNSDFDWPKHAEELNLELKQVREFITYFASDQLALKLRDLEICVGASCVAKGSLEIWRRVEQANQGRVPEAKIKLKSNVCLGECDRAPCAREAHKFHAGSDLAWLARLEAE